MVVLEGLIVVGPALVLVSLAVFLFGNWYRTASTPAPAVRYDLVADERQYRGLTVMWVDPDSAHAVEREPSLVSTLRRDR